MSTNMVRVVSRRLNVVAFPQTMSRFMSHQTSNSNRRRIKMQLQFGNKALDSSRGTAAGSRNQGILSTNGFVGAIPNAAQERRSRYTRAAQPLHEHDQGDLLGNATNTEAAEPLCKHR